MTYNLWDGEMIESFHQAALPSNLALFQPTNSTDIIVQYDELSPWWDSVRRRTYYLDENEQRIQGRKKPVFVSATVTNQALPIPIVTDANFTLNGAASSTERLPCAIRYGEENVFTIAYANGTTEGPYHLPGYRGMTGNMKLAGFTPVTVTADASVIIGIAAWIYLSAWAQSGAPLFWPTCK